MAAMPIFAGRTATAARVSIQKNNYALVNDGLWKGGTTFPRKSDHC